MTNAVLQHQHCIVRCEVEKPYRDPYLVQEWLKTIIYSLGMKPMFGPVARYCWTRGNRGVTGFATIETSHIAVHIWDEPNPALVQFDVYTCGAFKPELILEHLDSMTPVKMEYKWLDREKNLTELEHYKDKGNESNNTKSNSKT